MKTYFAYLDWYLIEICSKQYVLAEMDTQIWLDQILSFHESQPIRIVLYPWWEQMIEKEKELFFLCSLTNSCLSIDVLSIAGVRSNKSKKIRAADSDWPIWPDLYMTMKKEITKDWWFLTIFQRYSMIE